MELSEYIELPWCSAGKESPFYVEDLVSIPVLRRSPGEGNSYSLLYSCLENSMDCIVHGVAKSWTQLIHDIYCISFYTVYIWYVHL